MSEQITKEDFKHTISITTSDEEAIQGTNICVALCNLGSVLVDIRDSQEAIAHEMKRFNDAATLIYGDRISVVTQEDR
jgi:hypothetical protein